MARHCLLPAQPIPFCFPKRQLWIRVCNQLFGKGTTLSSCPQRCPSLSVRKHGQKFTGRVSHWSNSLKLAGFAWKTWILSSGSGTAAPKLVFQHPNWCFSIQWLMRPFHLIQLLTACTRKEPSADVRSDQHWLCWQNLSQRDSSVKLGSYFCENYICKVFASRERCLLSCLQERLQHTHSAGNNICKHIWVQPWVITHFPTQVSVWRPWWSWKCMKKLFLTEKSPSTKEKVSSPK